MGTLHRLPNGMSVPPIGATDIKGHDDVGTQGLLVHGGGLRGESVDTAVQVGLEGNALFVDLAQVFQAEALEAAAIGYDGALPGHKGTETSQLSDHLCAGAQVEVIGVSHEYSGP